MNANPRSSLRTARRGVQSGQAIVIIALVMVGLIGALGLAIDGGGLMFMYRDIQNATDAAVVAATYARCTNASPEGVIAAGMQAARDNGFNNDGVTNWVTVSNPPPVGAERAGDINFVEVTIRAVKPSYFIQLVYPSGLEVTNGSTGHCRPAFDPGNLGAIFGIAGWQSDWDGDGDLDGKHCSATVESSGSDTTINGNVFSNSDLDPKGNAHNFDFNGDVAVHQDIKPGDVTFNGDVHVGPADVPIRPDPLAAYYPQSVFEPNGPIWNATPSNLRFQYEGDQTFSRQLLVGYYFVDGNVTLRHPEASTNTQGFTLVATGTITITQGGTLSNYSGTGSSGFLFVSFARAECGGNGNRDSVIDYSGASDNTGVLYAPYGGINASNSSGNWVGALIGQRVTFSGSSVTLTAQRLNVNPIPPQVEFAQ